MIAPETLIIELMVRVRRELYTKLPDKSWYQQQDTVKRALTFPAAWLEERKVPMSSQRYREIVGGILDTIRDNRQAQHLAFPCAYFYKCVQEHMAHHGDTYYQEGKSARNRVTLEMAALEDRRAAGALDVIPTFAQVHATLAIGKSKGRPKTSNPIVEADLFANFHGEKASEPTSVLKSASRASKPGFPLAAPLQSGQSRPNPA